MTVPNKVRGRRRNPFATVLRSFICPHKVRGLIECVSVIGVEFFFAIPSLAVWPGGESTDVHISRQTADTLHV